MKSLKARKLMITMVLALLILSACSSKNVPSNSTSAESTPSASLVSDSQNTMSESSRESEQSTQALEIKQANEIMCIFGAKRKVQYDANGQPLPSNVEEYQTSALSFYYDDEEGITYTQDITPYGFYGWYLQYTLLQSEKVAQIIPEFERFVFVRNDPVSGEIYGAPGDAYEKIVTSFFDVDVQQLRGDGLYDETAHAYVPITGAGIGEAPSIRVVEMEQENERISLDIALEYQDSESYTLQLTVRKDESNAFAGIKFVSLEKK